MKCQEGTSGKRDREAECGCGEAQHLLALGWELGSSHRLVIFGVSKLSLFEGPAEDMHEMQRIRRQDVDGERVPEERRCCNGLWHKEDCTLPEIMRRRPVRC